VAFSPNGKYLVSGSSDYYARLWNIESFEQLAKLEGHNFSKVLTVAFSPDGKYFASGSDDNNIKVWDVSLQKEVQGLFGHSS
jgi:WD40 repeat protein